MSEVRLQVFKHLEALPVGSFESQHSGDLISRSINDVGQLEAIYSNKLQLLTLCHHDAECYFHQSTAACERHHTESFGQTHRKTHRSRAKPAGHENVSP